MTQEQVVKSLEKLVAASAVLTNLDNAPGYYRKQGDWDRLKNATREARKLLKEMELKCKSATKS